MFGFSLAAQLFQGSAQRTWNCVTQFTNLLWYKFNHFRHPIMPRSRRRHHSRSRSRSRSHSHDRDRDAKRRKIDTVDSPAHKRSVSSEPSIPVSNDEVLIVEDVEQNLKQIDNYDEGDTKNESNAKIESAQNCESVTSLEKINRRENGDDKKQKSSTSINDEPEKCIKQVEDKLVITPKKTFSPKQLQKKLDSEKKRQQRQMEREERERKKQEEKERLRLEKEQVKKEKEEQKTKERELKEEKKRKEREEKEARRKEKEEREETKRREREQEKLKKQQELDEKNREKQKIEEQKQKAAQAFANFFVAKKAEIKSEEDKSSVFMPFEIKSDMRLAPSRRPFLTDDEKEALTKCLHEENEEILYLDELRQGKAVGKCLKTWPFEEDVIIIEEDVGESICEDKHKLKTMRVKFLKFHENRRPAYYGTWRKKSALVNGRRPFVEDKKFFDYEVDSDDDWEEEEEQGESLNGSDDEEKENEVENDEYEVDNEFFVPHGHLSDDEVDDELSLKLSPESHKQKLKLLKDEFDQDMRAKINKIKPRSIGCIWYSKDKNNVDDAIDRHLKPLAMITNGQIVLKKRKFLNVNTPVRKFMNELKQELVPVFLKLIHGSVNKKYTIVEDFLSYMQNNGYVVEVSKTYLRKCLKQFAQWRKCTDEGPMFNKYCWCVEDEVKKKYNYC